MGCDIHVYVDYELKKLEEGQTRWVHNLGQFRVGRDYLLFGIMGGGSSSRCQTF